MRWLEYLGLYLTGRKADRERDKETFRLAEDIAAKRRLELTSEQYGFAMSEAEG